MSVAGRFEMHMHTAKRGEERECWKVIVGRVIGPRLPAAGRGVGSCLTLTADEMPKLLSIGGESLSRGDER